MFTMKSLSNPGRLLFLLGGTIALLMDATQGAKTGSLDHAISIFDWVRSAPGGIYHPDQEFRKDTETGITGVFAAKDIPEGTVLVSVPWSHVIPSDDPTERGQLCCGLVERLKREWNLGKKSKYAPYIEYLKSNTQQSQTALPTTWSMKGQALLQAILGPLDQGEFIPPLEPFKWLTGVEGWFAECGGKSSDKVGIQAAFIVIQRSDDHILIPGTY
jgi:hypothetical protein